MAATYEQQPTSIEGAWRNVSGGTVTVDTTENFTSISNGCTATGKATPDASGKNFHRLTVTTGPAPCSPANATGQGILFSDGANLLAAIVSGGTGGLVVATKN